MEIVYQPPPADTGKAEWPPLELDGSFVLKPAPGQVGTDWESLAYVRTPLSKPPAAEQRVEDLRARVRRLERDLYGEGS